MIEVDGSMMEGGGQILRMAVTYSAAIGVPVRIRNIRAKRRPPGLRPQHLTTLRAVADMCLAETRGLKPNSMEVEFRPRPPKGGKYEFDIGTAGSIGLLFQCVAPVSAFSDSTVTLRVIGGTAVRWSPPVHILDKVVWRAFRNMGFVGGITIQREGFYPRGGGIVDVTIDPMREVRPLRADAKGEVRRVLGISKCGRLPRHVADRQARSAQATLANAGYKSEISVRVAEGGEAPFSPGSLICLWAESDPEMFIGASSLGERGKRAEKVGSEAATSLIEEINSFTAVDMHTADNLVLWCSLAGGESVYTTSRLTMHTRTAIELAKIFTDAEFEVEGAPDGFAKIRCSGVGLKNPNA